MTALVHLEGADQIHAAMDWVRDESNFQAVSDMTEKARLLREVLRLRKASSELRIEATRLECQCLRRLGQLGTKEKGHWGATARAFAAMADAEFDELMASISDVGSPNTIRLRWEHKRYEEQRQQRYRQSVDSGRTFAPYDFTERPDIHVVGVDGFVSAVERLLALETPEDLADQVRDLLGDLVAHGEPFTVAEAAAKLAVRLGLEPDALDDYGAKELIREHIRRDMSEEPGEYWPRFVTYHDDEIGWVRVPFNRATVEQIRYMASTRLVQAQQYMNKAESFAEKVTEVFGRSPKNAYCKGVWERECAEALER